MHRLPGPFVPGIALLSTAFLGAFAVFLIPAAKADVLPAPPTLPVPAPTVTLPAVSLPVTTPGGTTTTSPSTPDGGGSSTGASSEAERGPAAADVAGAMKLADGSVSIPASSLVAGARLVIGQVVTSPRTIRARGQKLWLAVRITDIRGYVVRGARVEARSVKPGRLVQLSGRTTKVDGTAFLLVRTTKLLPLHAGAKLAVVVRAAAGGVVASKQILLPIKPR